MRLSTRITIAATVAVAAVAIGAQTAHAARSTTVYVDISRAAQLPAAQAAGYWSNARNVDLVTTQACNGTGCIHVVSVPEGGTSCGTPPPGYAFAGCARRNGDGSYTTEITNTSTGLQRLAITGHEIGHGLGLPHTSGDPKSLMAGQAAPGPTVYRPNGRDLSNLAALYANPR